jgi:predicted secreted protein
VGIGDRERGDGLVGRLADARSRRVVLLSHCLLNENVRYLGGATRPGAVTEVVEPYLRAGVGVVQLPCPEQHAWGGVLKPHLLHLFGSRALRVSALRRPVIAVLRALTLLRCRPLVRRTARLVADYRRSGLEVVEVVGVGASPSCGVTTTLDLDGAVRAMAWCRRCSLAPATVNRQVVGANVVAGTGLFVSALQRRLARDGLDVPMREHDLLAELGQGLTVSSAGRSPAGGP